MFAISITTAALLISLLELEYKCSLAVTTYSSCVLQLYDYGGNVIVNCTCRGIHNKVVAVYAEIGITLALS